MMRRVLLRLVMIGVSIVIALALCEIIMRAFHLGDTRTVVLYNGKIFKLPPHTKLMEYRENNNLIETNNLGFHDFERQATNDNYRILFLGDSFVEGRQVRTENLFTVRLEKAFLRDGQRIETINGGVPSTGTAYQYVLWKEFFEPGVKVDHVVLCFFMGNDLVDNNRDLRLATFGGSDSDFFVDSGGNILDVVKKPGASKQTINYVRNHSLAMNALYEGAYRIKRTLEEKAEENGGATEVRGDRAAGAWEASIQGTIALLRRWKAELAAKNVPFDVVIIDQPGRVYSKYQLKFLETLPAACEQDQIGYLRLKLDGDPYELYSFDGISLGHFNDQGHAVAAGELYDYFKTRHAEIFQRSTAPAPR